MDSISNIFSKRAQSPLMRGIQAGMVVTFVAQWITLHWGKGTEGEFQVVSVKNGLLTIACLSPSLANTIKMQEKQLLKEVNDKFGEGTVTRMKIMV